MTKKIFVGALVALVACGTPQNEQTTQTTATPLTEGETIELQEIPREAGVTINEALWARKSSRDFTAEPLTLEELSGVVWAAAGVNRPENQHLTAPSALALYPIRTYIFLAGGAYCYEADSHLLSRVVEGDHRPLTAMQEFANLAPVNLVYVADLSVYEGRNIPRETGRHLAGLDAAGYAENANLYAAGHGLKAITRGSYQAEALLQLLGLDPDRYTIALAQTIGK